MSHKSDSPAQETAAEAAQSDTFRSVLRVAVLTLLMLLAVAGIKSYRDLNVARAHEAELESRIERTEESIEILEKRIERMRDDPTMLEQLAREELGWVRDGDLVVVLPEED
ncbi:MAG: septum formation initiator family protein [Acidobacteriota bacterium]